MQTNHSEPYKKVIDFEKARYMKENHRRAKRRTLMLIIGTAAAVVIAIVVFLATMAGRMFGGSADFWEHFGSGAAAAHYSSAEGSDLFQ